MTTLTPEDLVNKLRLMSTKLNAGGKSIALQSADLIASLIPKPIEEAPRDENISIFVFPNMTTTSWDLEKECYTKWSQYWDDTVPLKQQPTHYLPLEALTALMPKG